MWLSTHSRFHIKFCFGYLCFNLKLLINNFIHQYFSFFPRRYIFKIFFVVFCDLFDLVSGYPYNLGIHCLFILLFIFIFLPDLLFPHQMFIVFYILVKSVVSAWNFPRPQQNLTFKASIAEILVRFGIGHE